ncbi:MAG: hypothetical protein U0T56_12820 [Ferruginibacter sp.]
MKKFFNRSLSQFLSLVLLKTKKEQPKNSDSALVLKPLFQWVISVTAMDLVSVVPYKLITM